jgi:hypothetical protein
MKAISVYLSLGEFKEVLELLLESKLYDIGTLFILSCQEYNIPLFKKGMTNNENNENLSENEKTIILIKKLFSGYGLLLDKIGNKKLSIKYKQKISDITEEKIDDISFVNELKLENQTQFIYSNDKDQIENEILKNYVEKQEEEVIDNKSNNETMSKINQIFNMVLPFGKN